jgi:hypothetical protein
MFSLPVDINSRRDESLSEEHYGAEPLGASASLDFVLYSSIWRHSRSRSYLLSVLGDFDPESVEVPESMEVPVWVPGAIAMFGKFDYSRPAIGITGCAVSV